MKASMMQRTNFSLLSAVIRGPNKFVWILMFGLVGIGISSSGVGFFVDDFLC
jgi:hypothetical protein